MKKLRLREVNLPKIKQWTWDLRSGLRVRSRSLTCTRLHRTPPSKYLRHCLCFCLGYHSPSLHPTVGEKCSQEVSLFLISLSEGRRKYWHGSRIRGLWQPCLVHLWVHKNSFSCEEVSTYVSPQGSYQELYLPGRLEVVLSSASALYGFPFLCPDL